MVLVKIGALDAALGVSGVVCLDHDASFSLFLAAPMPKKGKPLVSWKQCLLLAGIVGGGWLGNLLISGGWPWTRPRGWELWLC